MVRVHKGSAIETGHYIIIVLTVAMWAATIFFSQKSRYSVLKKAARAAVAYGLLSYALGGLIVIDVLSIFAYKAIMMAAAFSLAYLYWKLKDNGWFSAPLFFLQIGLIWGLFYFITVNPNYFWFSIIYNGFAYIAYFFIIGCSLFRIRALHKLQRVQQVKHLSDDSMQDLHEELDPKKFPFHRYPEYIKE